jgi:hypothetical protein
MMSLSWGSETDSTSLDEAFRYAESNECRSICYTY